MSYFVKREIEGKPGEFEYVEVPDSDLEIPDEVLNQKVFNHPKFKEVVDESKKRKERIKELRTTLDSLAGEQETGEADKTNASPKTSEGSQTTTAPVQPLDEDALFAKFTARLAAEQAAAQKAANERNAQLAALATKNGLGEDIIPILAEAAHPEQLAEMLGKSKYRFDDSIGGSPAQPDEATLIGNVYKNLGLDGE